ncbi:hypothetical protein [Halocola ammonii]
MKKAHLILGITLSFCLFLQSCSKDEPVDRSNYFEGKLNGEPFELDSDPLWCSAFRVIPLFVDSNSITIDGFIFSAGNCDNHLRIYIKKKKGLRVGVFTECGKHFHGSGSDEGPTEDTSPGTNESVVGLYRDQKTEADECQNIYLEITEVFSPVNLEWSYVEGKFEGTFYDSENDQTFHITDVKFGFKVDYNHW